MPTNSWMSSQTGVNYILLAIVNYYVSSKEVNMETTDLSSAIMSTRLTKIARINLWRFMSRKKESIVMSIKYSNATILQRFAGLDLSDQI